MTTETRAFRVEDAKGMQSAIDILPQPEPPEIGKEYVFAIVNNTGEPVTKAELTVDFSAMGNAAKYLTGATVEPLGNYNLELDQNALAKGLAKITVTKQTVQARRAMLTSAQDTDYNYVSELGYLIIKIPENAASDSELRCTVTQGSYYHVVYYYLNEDGEKKQKWESFDTEAEAKHRKAEIEYKQGSRTFIAPSKTTVAAFLEDFVSLYGTKKWSPSTYEANTGLIRNYINPKLGSALMQDVTSIAADRFISALQRTKCPTYKNRYSKTEYMTPANIERINKLLRCAFGQAVRWDIIAKNPFENTTLPKIKRKPREIWDAATIRKALDECKDGRLYVAINLSFACSLRIGEIVGLTWDNIHISDADIASDNAYLCVEKELVRVREDSLAVLGEEEIIKKFPRTMYLEDASTVIVLKTPKTESSVRKVWMPKTVAHILREWKASQDKQKEFLGSEYLDYNLVVALPNGRPCEETVISNAFRRLKRDAQLPDVVFHSLRHSSTTYKLKLNHGDIKATQGDTGHSQADMVTKVYAHILDEDRKVNAQKFESAFYANPDLRGVQTPAEPSPALDVQSIILQLQQSPELLSALTSLISNQGCK